MPVHRRMERLILKKYRDSSTICISHFNKVVVHYTQQKEIRSENPIVTEHTVEDNTAHRKVKVSVMKKILSILNEFFKEYYNSFSTVCA